MTRKTIRDITQAKGQRKLVCTTAYTYHMARLLSDLEFDLLLVGDSVGMEIQGYPSTVRVTLDDIIYHLRAVGRGNRNCFLVADMPFMTAEISNEDSLRNAGKLIQYGHADAVKIEGGAEKAPLIRKLLNAGIPVMGHIGLNPQKILKTGTYQVQGKTAEAEESLLNDAKVLAESGVFAIVLECVPVPLSKKISQSISVPTIGIGAGLSCDGQILVCNDIIGLHNSFKPRFVKRYGNVEQAMRDAFTAYQEEVQNNQFPDPEHSYE